MCLSTWSRAEPLYLFDLDITGSDVDDGHEGLHEGDFEAGSLSLDDQPVLSRGKDHIHNGSTAGAHFEADEVFGPELLLAELPSSWDEHVEISDGFRTGPIGDSIEGNLMAAIGTAQRSNTMSSVVDVDDRAGLEMGQLCLVDI